MKHTSILQKLTEEEPQPGGYMYYEIIVKYYKHFKVETYQVDTLGLAKKWADGYRKKEEVESCSIVGHNIPIE